MFTKVENTKSGSHSSSAAKKKNTPFFQPQLQVGTPGGKYEVEADKVADQVVNQIAAEQVGFFPPAVPPKVHSKSTAFIPSTPVAETISPLMQKEEEEEDMMQMQPNKEEVSLQMQQVEEEELQTKPEDKMEEIQAKYGSGEVSSGFESSLNQSKESGSPLPDGVKGQMESGFGTDFSNVRIHTGSNAAQMSKSLGAQAFTHGSDIYFNEGKYNPESDSGKHLLAHELTHVIQQTDKIHKKEETNISFSEEEQELSSQFNENLNVDFSQNSENSISSNYQGISGNSVIEESPDISIDSMETFQDEPVSDDLQLLSSFNSPSDNFDNAILNEDVADSDNSFGEESEIPQPALFQNMSFGVSPSDQPEIQLQEEEDQGGIFGSIRNRFNSVVNSLRTGWTGLSQMASGAFSSVLSKLSGLTAGLKNIATSALSGIQNVWSGLSQMATQMANGVKQIVSGAISSIMGPISSISQAVMNLDAQAIRGAWRQVTGIIGNVWQRIKQTGQSIFQRIQNLWQRLKGRFTSVFQTLTARAHEIFSQMRIASQRISQSIVSAWNRIQNQASGMSGIFGGIARQLTSLVNRLMSWGQQIWDSIRRGWNLLSSRIGNFFQGIFDRISAFWQKLKQYARNFWKRIVNLWNRLKNWVVQQVRRFTSGLQTIWNRFNNFSIGSIVDKIAIYAPFIKSLQEAVANPDAAMTPLVDAMAIPLQNGMPSIAISMGSERASQQVHGQSIGGNSSSGIIQMKTDGSVIQLNRDTASIYEVNDGMQRHIREKWSKIEVWKMLKDMLWTLLWPWPTVGHEIYAFFAEDLYTVFFNNLFVTRNLFTDPLGFLHDMWTNLLHLGDIPLMAWRRINNIGMALLGWLTIALVIIGAVGGSVAAGIIGAILSAAASLGVAAPAGGAAGAAAGGLAGAGAGLAAAMAIGEVLVASFVGAHGISIIKAFVDLFTGNQTDDEKEDDYSQIADSLIGIGITAILVFVGWVASKFAAVVLNVIRRIRGPRPAETAPAEGLEPVREGDAVPEQTLPELSGRRPASPEYPVVDANGVLTEYGRWYYEKPPGLESGFRTNTKAEIWEQARSQSSDGVVRDPVSGEEIHPDSSWRVEERPDHPLSERQQSAAERGISREEFLDDYNNPEHYRVREEQGSGSEFSGNRPAVPEQPVLDAEGVLTEYGKWYYERPSGYRSGVRDTVWDNAVSESIDGVVRDPVTLEEMVRTDPWEMGHRYGYEFWKHRQSAAERGISRETFLDEHNHPNHYRPETPESNSSHQGEAPANIYYGE